MIELTPGEFPQGTPEEKFCKVCGSSWYTFDDPRCDCEETHHVDCCPWLAALHEQAIEEEKRWLEERQRVRRGPT